MTPLEDVWRREAPHVLVALVRRYGDFDACEDALQDAGVQATTQWARDGVPEQPRGWLVRVASRRLVDRWRSEWAREAREGRAAADPATGPSDLRSTADTGDPGNHGTGGAEDDTLHLLTLCCHPSLTPSSQVALTLRAVAGLTTAQIAAAFLVPEATMGQRISRAKATLRDAGARFEEPPAGPGPERLVAVRHVLYLIFNEGYTTSGGQRLVDVALTEEAVRLCRALVARLPHDDETAGLLALMLLTGARTRARTDRSGDLVPLADQDRTRWDATAIAEGVAILEHVLPGGGVGRYQLEAAIAAVHAESADHAATDWLQIAALYSMLDQVSPGPTVTLARAVAVAMVDGPLAALALVEPMLTDRVMARHHRTHAVRGHLLELDGRRLEAAQAYGAAARLTTSRPEQRYLNARAAAAASAAQTE